MFCTECGTKLEDGVVFCTNCGHKLETVAAASGAAMNPPVAEPVSQSMYSEPVSQSMYSEPVSQSMYSEPAGQSMYSEPVSQSMYSEPASQSMYSEPAGQSMYSEPTNQTMYGAGMGQPIYGNHGQQNTYAASNQANPSYNYSGATQQPQKKKGKGCLIAALIGGGVFILLILVIVIAIIAGVMAFGGEKEDGYDDYSYDYDYDDYSFDYDDDDYSYDDDDDTASTGSKGTYSIDDITGSWTGTTSLVQISGASEMQEYLEELYGRSLSSTEVAGLSTVTAADDYTEVEIYEYYDDDEYDYYPGSWQITLDMGDFFGKQIWDDWDAITYDQYMNGERDAGCIELDENNCFYIEAMEMDYIGEYGSQFFFVDDTEVEEDGAYGIVFAGQVSEGTYGLQIDGEIIIMFQYGDMEEPYMMQYEYTLDDIEY